MAKCPKCGSRFDAGEGKIARCPDCRASFKNVPEKDDDDDSRKSKKKKKEKEKEKPKEKPVTDDDMYGFAGEEDLTEVRKKREEADEKKKEAKKNDAKPIITVKRKNIGDLEVWAKIDKSMIWFLAGILILGFIHLLHGLILILGVIQGPEFAGPVVRFLIRPDQPPFELGEGDVLDRASFIMAMLGGSDNVGLTFGIMIFMQILGWAQTGVWMAGYSIAWPSAPVDEGGKGQLIACYSLGGFNFLMNFFLVFLPMVGAYSYLMVPLWGTEMAMAEFNMERSVGLHLFWSFSPFVEEIFTILVLCCRYMEPLMICYFIWTVGYAIKDEPLEKMAIGSLRMGFAILFLLVTFHVFAMTGSSPVLVKVLRILYLLWYFFIVGWVIRVFGLIGKCRELFYFYFHPEAD